jgi:hypothetical protein
VSISLFRISGLLTYFEKTIRTAKPLPSNVAIAYFEITIIDAGARGYVNFQCLIIVIRFFWFQIDPKYLLDHFLIFYRSIGIGLSTEGFILNKKPGWDDR